MTAKGQTGKKKDKLKFDKNIPFSVHPAVKFYRDGVFALCQGVMNGWVKTEPKKTEGCAGSTEQTIEYQDNLCNQKPYISEFEYQLNELRDAVVKIFEAETDKAESEARKTETKLARIRNRNKKD